MLLNQKPATEEERQKQVKLWTALDNAHTRHCRIYGGKCRMCQRDTIVIDLTPSTVQCEHCDHVEEV